MKSVEFPKKERKKKRALTNEEKEYIRRAELSPIQRLFVDTLLYAGLRREEILALEKSDINLKNKTLNVSKAIIFKGNHPELKPYPKSEAGIRVIPLVDSLAGLFENAPDSIIFPHPSGGYHSKNTFRLFWRNIHTAINSAAGDAGISNDITPHIFRHTYGTTLYYAGIDIKTAQYLLGHSSIQVTLDIYTHLDRENDKVTIDKLNKFISQ